MSVIQRAQSIYRDQGLESLFRKGSKYVVWDLFPEKVLWNVVPKTTTKRVVARSKTLRTLYFAFRRTFDTEQKALLYGQAKYHENEVRNDDPRHRIIRNVHRLEKGLSMDDRRAVFAEGYIEETVADVLTAWNTDETNDDQLRWAVDVLAHYFEVVEPTQPIARAEETFRDFLASIDYEPKERTPKPRREIERDPVDYEALRQLAEQRTSTRWFEQRDVPRDLIDDALEVALQSPSACNRQSFEFRIYDDPDVIDDITELPIGVAGYRDNIPCLAVIVGKHRAYFHDRDRHVIYIDASLAAMAFQFALETRGLASCCINWPVIPWRERRMADLLNLDEDEEVIMLMAIGYPDSDGMVPYSEKKDVERIRSFNER